MDILKELLHVWWCRTWKTANRSHNFRLRFLCYHCTRVSVRTWRSVLIFFLPGRHFPFLPSCLKPTEVSSSNLFLFFFLLLTFVISLGHILVWCCTTYEILISNIPCFILWKFLNHIMSATRDRGIVHHFCLCALSSVYAAWQTHEQNRCHFNSWFKSLMGTNTPLSTLLYFFICPPCSHLVQWLPHTETRTPPSLHYQPSVWPSLSTSGLFQQLKIFCFFLKGHSLHLYSGLPSKSSQFSLFNELFSQHTFSRNFHL